MSVVWPPAPRVVGRGVCGPRGSVAAHVRMRRLASRCGGTFGLDRRLDTEEQRPEHDGQVRRVARVLPLHARARGVQLPRPERGWRRNPDLRLQVGAQPAVAPIRLRSTVLQTPHAGRRADPRWAAAGPRPNAAHLAVHADAWDLGVPRSNACSAVQPGRLQRHQKQRRRVAGNPRVDRREIARVRAGGCRVRLLIQARR